MTYTRIVLSSPPLAGYEMISIGTSPSNIGLTVSSNGMYTCIFDSNLNTYLSHFPLEPAWAGIATRSVRHYGRYSNNDLYLLTRSNNRAYLIDVADFLQSGQAKSLKQFTVSTNNPEITKYIPNSNFMIVFLGYTIDFLNIEGSDSDTLTYTIQ